MNSNESKINKFETLHCHTTVSDGSLVHQEVLQVCSKNNVGVVAFTDHDSLPNEKIYKRLLSSKNVSTDWIIGIEISADKPIDFKVDFSPHIVGLFVDPFNKELINHCKLAQEARRKRMADIVKHLKVLGFEIDEQDCMKASGGETVGRPHIVKALKSVPHNLEVIENLRKKMESDASRDEDIKIEYDEMMRRGEDQYPYVLFLSDNSYIKGVYVDYLYRIDMDGCVKIIRNAGGAAFFAHWFTEIKNCGEDKIEQLLSENRLDGMETVYGFYDDMKDGFLKQRRVLKKLLTKYNKLESGGVDVHTKEHIKSFSQDKWYAGMTVGMAGKIVASGKVDTKWSSLDI